jgi:hypothetical protein
MQTDNIKTVLVMLMFKLKNITELTITWNEVTLFISKKFIANSQRRKEKGATNDS